MFRYEITQAEVDYAKAFCNRVGGGTYCCTPPSCHGCCLATAMIVCPEAVIKRCQEGYVCYQPDLRYASECRQLVDLVPAEARRYGMPTNVTRTDGSMELRVPMANGAITTYVPRRCRGPFPALMEEHINFMASKNLPEEWAILTFPSSLMTTATTPSIGAIIGAASGVGTSTATMTTSTTSTMPCYIF